MAYKLETARILPNGLNLVAPGDQVSEGDCLDLQGWWPGAAGRVEASTVAAFVAGTAPVFGDSLCQMGTTYYLGNSTTGSVYRGVTLLNADYDAFPVGMISYQGFTWIINRAHQRKDDGATTSDWTIAPPAAPNLEDGGDTGAGLHYPFGSGFVVAANNPPLQGALLNTPYQYYVTWQTTLGETNPSAVATITPAPATLGAIVRIFQPAGAPATATGWNIYREIVGTPYLLNEDGPLGLARTYVDDYGDEVHTHSDTQMLQLGIIMQGDHDAPPAAKIMANQTFNGRIVVGNTDANPNRLFYTQALQPGFFRGAANPNDGDWVDVGTDAKDGILGVSVKPGLLIIYRDKSIWRQVGDFDDANARLEPLVPEMGIVGPRAFYSSSVGEFFRSDEGVFILTDWARPISTKVNSLFHGGAVPENFLAEATPSVCALGYENGRLWVSYKEVTFTRTVIWHMPSDRWFSMQGGFNAYAQGSAGLLGSQSGIYQLPGAAGSPATAFQSAYLDGGSADREKTFADLVIDHFTGGVPLTITIRTNKNRAPATDEFVLGTITSSVKTKELIPLVYPSGYSVVALRGQPIRAYNMSIRITGNMATGCQIDSPLIVHFYYEARHAKTFDTDETDHGIQGHKQIDQVELDVDARGGNGNFQPYADSGGGAMAAAALEAILSTTTRQSERIVLTRPIIGKLLRYTAYSTTDFQLYGLRVRVLPIGVYLDGAVGDFWQPEPTSIGV